MSTLLVCMIIASVMGIGSYIVECRDLRNHPEYKHESIERMHKISRFVAIFAGVIIGGLIKSLY